MITSIHEVYVGKTPDPDDEWLFWTYMICRVRDGNERRYDLIRIDNAVSWMECLGRELTLKHCREIISRHQPEYKRK